MVKHAETDFGESSEIGKEGPWSWTDLSPVESLIQAKIQGLAHFARGSRAGKDLSSSSLLPGVRITNSPGNAMMTWLRRPADHSFLSPASASCSSFGVVSHTGCMLLSVD